MSVQKRRDGRGRVRYQVYVWDSLARRKRYVGTFDRQRDAEEAERKYKLRRAVGDEPQRREEISFEALAGRWSTTLVHVRPSTREDYRKAIRRVSPYLGRKLVSEIERRDFDELIVGLSTRYSARTVRKTVTITKMVFRFAIDWGYVDSLPTGGSRLNLPRVRKRRFDPLTKEEVRRLIECAPDYWKPWYLFMLTTGARRSESFGLQACDLDLDHGFVRIRQQLIKGKLVTLKTEAADRRCPLPVQTVEALISHMRSRPANQLDLVFPSPEGRPVDPSNFYARVWNPTRVAAGLPKLRVHDCRHHVASLMLSQGRSIKYAQTVMGHATASVLLDVYGHLAPGEEVEAMDDMSRWMEL